MPIEQTIQERKKEEGDEIQMRRYPLKIDNLADKVEQKKASKWPLDKNNKANKYPFV